MSHTVSFTTPDYTPAARIVQRGLATLSELCRWISHTGDPDLPPNSCVSGRTLRQDFAIRRRISPPTRLDPALSDTVYKDHQFRLEVQSARTDSSGLRRH